MVSLPPRYVLFVSTIELRKNHRLLVRVWQRLLERHRTNLVPNLVFAGKIGWLVDDLRQVRLLLDKRVGDAVTFALTIGAVR